MDPGITVDEEAAVNHAMKEVVFVHPNVVELHSFEEPSLTGEQVRVKTLMSGISHGTEMNLLRGTAPGFSRRWDKALRLFRNAAPHKSYPVLPGYECVGSVVETGPGVEGLSAGTLVWVDKSHRSTHLISAAEARAGMLPPGMKPERGIFCALARVALGGIHDANIKVGDVVAVVGLGVIGLMLAQLALLSGASTVFALDPYRRRLDLARRFGAEPQDSSVVDAAARVKEMRGPGVDVAIDASGRYEGLHLALACCRPGGRVVAVSSYQGEASGLRLGEEFHRNRLTISSSMTVNEVPHRDHPCWTLDRLNETARRLLHDGRLRVEEMLTHVFPIEEAEDAYRLIAENPSECVKVAFRYPS